MELALIPLVARGPQFLAFNLVAHPPGGVVDDVTKFLPDLTLFALVHETMKLSLGTYVCDRLSIWVRAVTNALRSPPYQTNFPQLCIRHGHYENYLVFLNRTPIKRSGRSSARK